MNKRIRHDVSWAAAHASAKLVSHLLRPEEQGELVLELYHAFCAALEAYDRECAEERRRLCKPSENGR